MAGRGLVTAQPMLVVAQEDMMVLVVLVVALMVALQVILPEILL